MPVLNPHVSKKLVDLYQDNFIYLDHDHVFFDSTKCALYGKLVSRGAPYLKKTSPELIFNNVEAIIARNQIVHVMLACFIAYQNNQDITDEEILKKYYQLNGNFVIKEDIFSFHKPLYNEAEISFFSTIVNYKKTKTGTFYSTNTNIGEENNFQISLKGFLLPYDIHETER